MRELLDEIGKKVAGNENGEDTDQIGFEKLLIRDAVFLRQDGNLMKVKYDDILWLKGDGNYTTVVTRKSVFSVRNILKDFESVLPLDRFMRIHKSYIIQIAEIETINTKEVKVGIDLVPVGRTYYPLLINGIQKLGSFPN